MKYGCALVRFRTSPPSTHPQTEGLGPIGSNRDKTIGLWLHSTLALSLAGEPLGVLASQSWRRDPRQFGSSRHAQQRNGQPIQEKESARWLESLRVCQELAGACPGTLVVSVADREGRHFRVAGPGLERAAAGPCAGASPAKELWPLLHRQPVAATLEVPTPRQTGRPARRAVLRVRFTAVTLCAPSLKAGQPPLAVWGIEAREEHPPKGAAAIHWRLLTTLPVASAEEAVEKIRWYTGRWQIEVWPKVLKSGCKIEQRQLETAARLRRVLMFDLIVAWRVMRLSQAARHTPEASAGPWLAPAEWIFLGRFQRGKMPPKQPPSLRQVVLCATVKREPRFGNKRTK